MSNGPEDSRGRWWEIHGEDQSNEGGHRELMIDSRGRSRPERSLSAGADLAEESRNPARAFLWPVVSVVAAAGLVLSVVYVVSKNKPPSSASATSREAAASGSAQSGSAQGSQNAKQNLGAAPAAVLPPAVSQPVAGGGTFSPIGGRADAPRGTGGPAVDPAGPVGTHSGGSGGAAADTGNRVGNEGNQPATAPIPSSAAPPREPQITLDNLDGHAPAAPKTRQTASVGPETGAGGCSSRNTSRHYTCTVTRTAPLYFPEKDKPDSNLRAGHPTTFLCQTAGSPYSVGSRVNYWWAWLELPVFGGVWIPVVFLEDAPDNGPEPGLPGCDRAPTSTTASSRPPTSVEPKIATTPPADTEVGPR